jgi:hypothetical protein
MPDCEALDSNAAIPSRTCPTGTGGVPTYVREQLGYSTRESTVDVYGHRVPGLRWLGNPVMEI